MFLSINILLINILLINILYRFFIYLSKLGLDEKINKIIIFYLIKPGSGKKIKIL